jgi:hypothetical protein
VFTPEVELGFIDSAISDGAPFGKIPEVSSIVMPDFLFLRITPSKSICVE